MGSYSDCRQFDKNRIYHGELVLHVQKACEGVDYILLNCVMLNFRPRYLQPSRSIGFVLNSSRVELEFHCKEEKVAMEDNNAFHLLGFGED